MTLGAVLARRPDVEIDRSRVVEEPDVVVAVRRGTRKRLLRKVRGSAMGDDAQPLQAAASESCAKAIPLAKVRSSYKCGAKYR